MSEGYSNVEVTEESGCIVLVFTDPGLPTIRVRMSIEQSRTLMERIRAGLAGGDTDIGVVEVLEASVDRKEPRPYRCRCAQPDLGGFKFGDLWVRKQDKQ